MWGALYCRDVLHLQALTEFERVHSASNLEVTFSITVHF
jgi:hypothetical protein